MLRSYLHFLRNGFLLGRLSFSFLILSCVRVVRLLFSRLLVLCFRLVFLVLSVGVGLSFSSGSGLV